MHDRSLIVAIAVIATNAIAFASGCASDASSSAPISVAPAPASSGADASGEKAPAPDPTHWRSIASLATARSAHTATLLADGRVRIWSS